MLQKLHDDESLGIYVACGSSRDESHVLHMRFIVWCMLGCMGIRLRQALYREWKEYEKSSWVY